jgi:hypothetical protein
VRKFKEKNRLSHPFLRSVAPNMGGNGCRVKDNKVKSITRHNKSLSYPVFPTSQI